MLFGTPRHYLILAWTLVLLISFFSLLPGTSLPKLSWAAFLSIDKIGHFLVYGVTAWSFSRYYKLRSNTDYSLVIFCFLFLLGISMECLQFFLMQGRHFDLLDILANAIGIFFGLKFLDLIFNFIFKGASE